jgi:hypothetical protein
MVGLICSLRSLVMYLEQSIERISGAFAVSLANDRSLLITSYRIGSRFAPETFRRAFFRSQLNSLYESRLQSCMT